MELLMSVTQMWLKKEDRKAFVKFKVSLVRRKLMG